MEKERVNDELMMVVGMRRGAERLRLCTIPFDTVVKAFAAFGEAARNAEFSRLPEVARSRSLTGSGSASPEIKIKTPNK